MGREDGAPLPSGRSRRAARSGFGPHSKAFMADGQLLQTARRQFAEGGERIRYSYPPLIASGIQLARRFKLREQVVRRIYTR